MKFPFPGMTVAAAVCAALAVPTAASASPTDAVLDHVKNARSALKDVIGAVEDGKDKIARKRFARNVKQTNKAIQTARSAGYGASASQAVSLIQPIARLEDMNVETYADLVDEVPSGIQPDVADELEEAMAVRALLFDTLAALMEDLPTKVQETIAKILATIFEDHEEEVDDIGDAIDGGVPPDVEDTLSETLDMAFDLAKQALGTLEGVLDFVPDSLRPMIENLLGTVEGVLDLVKDLVHDLLGGFLGGNGGGLLGLGDFFKK
jgi:bacterioferritin (cytochrome b1)